MITFPIFLYIYFLIHWYTYQLLMPIFQSSLLLLMFLAQTVLYKCDTNDNRRLFTLYLIF